MKDFQFHSQFVMAGLDPAIQICTRSRGVRGEWRPLRGLRASAWNELLHRGLTHFTSALHAHRVAAHP